MTAFSEFCATLGKEPEHVVKIGRKYFYDPEDLKQQCDKHGWEPTSVGLFLGEERKGFRATSALITLLANDKKCVVVTKKAAWMFLCANDILMEGVASTTPLHASDLAFVKDEQGNVLGYGRIVNEFSDDAEAVYVKHIVDKGEYLRREK